MHKIEIIANDDDLEVVKRIIEERNLLHLITKYE